MTFCNYEEFTLAKLGNAFCNSAQLHYATNTGVHSAAKSCWPEPVTDIHNGFNFSLDGMLTHRTFEPRAIWWAYEGYAQITGELVEVLAPAGSTIDGVCGYDIEAGIAKAIFGNCGQQSERQVNIVLANMDYLSFIDDDRIYVEVRRIPNTGTEVLDEPELVNGEFYEVVDNKIVVTIPEIKAQEAYTIWLQKR